MRRTPLQRTEARERGSVVVEFALTIPTVVLLVVGGVDIGAMIATRHELTDATNLATRAAAVAGIVDATVIRDKLQESFPVEKCSDLGVSAVRKTLIPPAAPADGVDVLEVTANCTLASTLFKITGGKTVTVVASMPLPPS